MPLPALMLSTSDDCVTGMTFNQEACPHPQTDRGTHADRSRSVSFATVPPRHGPDRFVVKHLPCGQHLITVCAAPPAVRARGSPW